MSLLKYNGDSKGLTQTAKITFAEKKKKSKPNSISLVNDRVGSSVQKTKTPIETKDKLSDKKVILNNLSAQKVDKNPKATPENINTLHPEKSKETPIWKDYEHSISDVWKSCINKEELMSINKSEGMMITVGLDFGTHQTKVCVESKGGVEKSYTFMKFGYNKNQMYYTLPSIIGICMDGRLKYGHLPNNFEGNIVKYFKQAVFRGKSSEGTIEKELSYYYSIWYIAYILFDLEEIFGQNFSIQMGAPTDSSHIKLAKQIATRIIASSYKLVEEVFENDKINF